MRFGFCPVVNIVEPHPYPTAFPIDHELAFTTSPVQHILLSRKSLDYHQNGSRYRKRYPCLPNTCSALPNSLDEPPTQLADILVGRIPSTALQQIPRGANGRSTSDSIVPCIPKAPSLRPDPTGTDPRDRPFSAVLSPVPYHVRRPGPQARPARERADIRGLEAHRLVVGPAGPGPAPRT